MPGKSSGFAIGFGIQDNASACIDAINKRIAALTAPAERFNKSLAKFGEVSGINRAAEGIQTLGDRALGAAHSIERLAGPMAGLTSAASLGGVIELSRKWAEAGIPIYGSARDPEFPAEVADDGALLSHRGGGQTHLGGRHLRFASTFASIRNNPGVFARLRSFGFNILKANRTSTLTHDRYHAALAGIDNLLTLLRIS